MSTHGAFGRWIDPLLVYQISYFSIAGAPQ